MTLDPERFPPWLATVLLAEDDTEDSVPGSDWHQEAIFGAHGELVARAEERAATGAGSWYVSSQVTIIVDLPRRFRPWQPKPDLFVVVGAPPAHRNSYDTRRDGPMPQFVLEVASESTWREDIDSKRELYALTGVAEYVVFDPTGELLRERVRAWRARSGSWEPWASVRRGDGTEVWPSETLQLELRVDGPLLRFDDPARGPLLVHRDVMQRWRSAEAAGDAERVAREAAEAARVAEHMAREAAEAARDSERVAREAAEQRAQAAEQALAALRQERPETGGDPAP